MTGALDCFIKSMLRSLPVRQRDDKARALTRRAARGDAATVSLDDLLADRQADAGALEAIVAMQALKWHENPVEIFFVEPDAIVVDDDPAVTARQIARQALIAGDRQTIYFNC